MIRWLSRSSLVAAVGLAAALLAAPAALASTPFADIASAGPLSDIYIGNDLGCQVRAGGFSSTEFFPNASGPGDCGTFVFLNGDNVDSQLWGPDFANHSSTETSFTQETPFTPDSQTFAGSGTAADPYVVTTVATATASEQSSTTFNFQIIELDSYVVGDGFYRTDITVKNVGDTVPDNGIQLYHAADCLLRGSNTGLGSFAQSTPACTVTPNNSPSSALESFVPLTGASDGIEASAPTVWSDVDTDDEVLPNSCGRTCITPVNNGEAIEWFVPSPAVGATSQTYSFDTRIADTAPAGGFSFTGGPGAAVGGTVATITEPNASATASAYSATIDWGDNTSSTGTITGGNGAFDVTGTHPYSAPGTYPISVTITALGTNQGSSTVTDSATIASVPTTTTPPATTTAPTPVLTGTPTVSATGAGFTGSVNPSGLATTAFFQYGLDPKYTGGGPVVYTNSTPAQPLGAGSISQPVSASVTGLVANALYHVRLVATNSAGTTFGPDVAFTTLAAPAPGSPALGRTFNVSVVSGTVLVKLHGQLVPLTELEQIPAGTVIDALHGTLKLTTALNGGSHARDAAAKAKKGKGKGKTKTQSGTFGGAVFKITQAHSGLATLSIVEGAFSGAPSYAICHAHTSADASAAALSSKTLQLLHASAHGKFRTTGRYSAATVRGTEWTIADKCNGTLTHDITDSVVVTDFVHHKTIVLHAGQSYLAKKP